MSKIKNCGLDQYDAEAFEQQQFGTAGVEGVNILFLMVSFSPNIFLHSRLSLPRADLLEL